MRRKHESFRKYRKNIFCTQDALRTCPWSCPSLAKGKYILLHASLARTQDAGEFSQSVFCLWKLHLVKVRLKELGKSWSWEKQEGLMSLGCPRANWGICDIFPSHGGRTRSGSSLWLRKRSKRWSNATLHLSQLLRRDSTSTYMQGNKCNFLNIELETGHDFLPTSAKTKKADSSHESGIVNSRNITGLIL